MKHVVEKLRKNAQEKNLRGFEAEVFPLLLTAACFQCCTDGPHGGNKSCAVEVVEAT